MSELVTDGQAFEGQVGKARGISRIPIAEKVDLTEAAIEAFIADPKRSLQNVADAVGCSKTLAHKAKKKAEQILKVDECSPEVFTTENQASEQ